MFLNLKFWMAQNRGLANLINLPLGHPTFHSGIGDAVPLQAFFVDLLLANVGVQKEDIVIELSFALVSLTLCLLPGIQQVVLPLFCLRT